MSDLESLALLDAIFESAPVALAYFDRELRFVRVNERLAEINGLSAEAHIGHTVPELLPGMDARVQEVFEQVLATGETVVEAEFAGATPAEGDRRRHFTASVYPVRTEGRGITGIGIVALDVTERREVEAERGLALELERAARTEAEAATRRAHFLAEAAALLDESLDYESTLQAVASLVVPWLADWCSVDIADSDGSTRRVASAHFDPERHEFVDELERRYPRRPLGDRGVYEVLRTGVAEIYPEVTSQMLAAIAEDTEHLQLLHRLEMGSVMIVPMVVRGHILGTVTFVGEIGGRQFDRDDLIFAEELARRAATSVDNARLYGERSYIARTLQESLLPPHLPDIPGVEVAARYRAGAAGHRGRRRLLRPVRDRRPELGRRHRRRVRQGRRRGGPHLAPALHAACDRNGRQAAERGPAPAQRRDPAPALRQPLLTVAYVRLTTMPDGARAHVANGGHPPPVLLRADGVASVVPASGTLLGVVPDPRLDDTAIDLGPGDTLVLYTDGVTEAGAPDRVLDPEQTAALVGSCSGDPDAVAGCIEQAAVEAAGGSPSDDIGIVVLRVAAGV